MKLEKKCEIEVLSSSLPTQWKNFATENENTENCEIKKSQVNRFEKTRKNSENNKISRKKKMKIRVWSRNIKKFNDFSEKIILYMKIKNRKQRFEIIVINGVGRKWMLLGIIQRTDVRRPTDRPTDRPTCRSFIPT